MYHYLFTNDLRISTLDESLKRAGHCFMTNSVPSAQENKNENNNMKTLGFYFNLTETSKCAETCANGNVRKVVLNFIKKFQFPNPRTSESLTDAINDKIMVAPMRVVLQVLYNMQMLYPEAAFLTREEIKDFVFYNSSVAKNKHFNVIELIEQIIDYRTTAIYPDSIDRVPENRQWKQEDRQIREMTKILTWAGCVSEDEEQRLFIHHDNLTTENKAALFDILMCNTFWNPNPEKNYAEQRQDYEAYMDLETASEDILGTDSTLTANDIFNHSVYGIHIMQKNDALSEENPHICIGWSAMGDLSAVSTKEELGEIYDVTWPDSNPRKKAQDIGQLWRFTKEMQIGDYVVFADGDVCHIGQITSDYYFDDATHADQDADYSNTRDVHWMKKNISRSELSEGFHRSLMTAMSVWTLNDYKSVIAQLLDGSYIKDVLFDEVDLLIKKDGFVNNLDADQLVNILNDMYDSANERNLSNTIRMFGFKYAESIAACGVAPQKLVDESIIDSNSYGGEITKAMNMYNSIKNNEYGIAFAEDNQTHTENFDYNDIKGDGINKIFYGTPGCGKSYHIDHKILGKDKATKEYTGAYEKENIIRTTFYQDYSNTDFVGQILPKVVKGNEGDKDTVEYIFNPGPFTLALIQAISNPTKKVALVIEEINRGNAPAIFGDIFQLLDRDDNAISEYGIVNVSLMDYLNEYEFTVNGEKRRYVFGDIKIPGNMDIFATMNTSDQNVYTLDTAFVRRWEKEKIKNTFDECDFQGESVPGMPNYTWKEFVEGINRWIACNIDSLQVNEDKQIGAFFVKKSLLAKNDPEKFAYKVFDYLWSDVAKFDHDIFFNSYNTLEELIEAYKEKGVGVFKTGIFDVKELITEREEENDE